MAAAISAAGFPAPALAQATVETVVVTGSRIPTSANLVSTSPVQSLSSLDFQLKGATDVVDLLNDLPQTFISNTADFSNTNNPLSTPGGVTTVDLRGLGPTRTMVLVNGRRLGVGDPNTGNPSAAPDLDQIPVPLIERVEVLTGGASATYGSDAVAGVVNFIMKKDFEGLQADAEYGGNWHDNDNTFARTVEADTIAANTQGPFGMNASHTSTLAPKSVFDGRTVSAALTIGTNTADGKGNVTAYVTYRSEAPVWMRDRDFAACQIDVVDGGQADRIDGASCAGSSNSNYFKPKKIAGSPVYSIVGTQALLNPQPGSSPPSSFNSNDYESLSRQDTRFTGGFFGHYDLAAWAQPYTEVMVMDDRSYIQTAPDAVFRGANALSPDGSGNWFTNCNNPLLSAQEVQTFCTGQGLGGGQDTPIEIGRRSIEGGPRYSTYEHESFRGVIGVKGDFADAWHYDAFGSYYYVTANQFNGNYLSNQKLNNALEVVNVAGVPTCKSVLSGADLNCVPYNIFTTGGVTPAQIAYLDTFGTSFGSQFEEVLEADVNGDLGKYGITSPFASDGVQVALGVTNRKDKLYYQADVAESSNDLVGFSGAQVPVNNAINVTEEYGEIRVPLIQHQQFAEELSAEGGIRFSSYSNGRKPTTWKSGLKWTPVDDVTLRTTYDVAIRAPSLLESFTPQTVTTTSLVSIDPCAPTSLTTPATATLAQCERTGVTPAQYGNGGSTNSIGQCPAGQCAVLLGGNPALSPEKAKTFSVGFTTTPSFLPGFSGSIDYFKIDVYNGIVQGIPLPLSLSECLNTGNPTFCSNIKRTSSGTLYGTTIAGGGYIVGTDVNSAYFNNTGIDFQAGYQKDLSDWGFGDYGSLDINFTATMELSAKIRNLVTNPVYDCVGLYGTNCGSPLPTWRHVLRVTWDTPWGISISPSWRFFGGTSLDSNSTDPSLSNGSIDRFNASIGAYSYFDLAVTWQATSQLQVRAGMNNVFDKDPPIVSDLITGTGTPNTYNNYDLLGRTVFLAVTAKD